MQEMEEQMSSLNDSGDLQDAESNYSGRLSLLMIPSFRSLLSRQTFATWHTGMRLDYRKTFLIINLLQLIRSKTIMKGLIILSHKVIQNLSSAYGRRPWIHEYRRIFCKILWLDSNRQQICLENSIENSSDNLFWFSIGSNDMDHGSKKWRWLIHWKNWSLRDQLLGRLPNFEMLDAKIASALNKIIQNSHSRRKSASRSRKLQKEDRFLRGRHIAFMIYDNFRVIGTHDTVLDYADLFSVTLRDDKIREFDTRWDEVLFSVSKITFDSVLEGLYDWRIRESVQLKIVLELYDLEIH